MPRIWKLTPDVAGQVDNLFEDISLEQQTEERLQAFMKDHARVLQDNPREKTDPIKFLKFSLDFFDRIADLQLDDKVLRRLYVLVFKRMLIDLKWTGLSGDMPTDGHRFIFTNAFDMWKMVHEKYSAEQARVQIGTAFGAVTSEDLSVETIIKDDSNEVDDISSRVNPAKDFVPPNPEFSAIAEETIVGDIADSRKKTRKKIGKLRSIE